MRFDTMPLPPHRHMPGRNARPDEAFFGAVKAATPAETTSDGSAGNQAWRYGIRLFNAGFYWEAHEVLEPVWANAAPNSRERHLVQAVIHLANGMLKREMGAHNARRRIAELCRKAFAEAFPAGSGRLMGLDGEAALRAAADLVEDRAEIRLAAYDEI